MAREIARRGSDFKSRPPSDTAPSLALHSPPSNRSSVLLPDPFGPTSASNPPRNSSEAWRRSQLPPILIPALSSSSLINRRRVTVSVSHSVRYGERERPVPYRSLNGLAPAPQ